MSLKLQALLKSILWSNESRGRGGQDFAFLNKLPSDAHAAGPWTTGRSQELRWPLCFFQVLGNEESKAQRTNMIVPMSVTGGGPSWLELRSSGS